MGVVGFGSCIPSELRKMAVIMVRREESWFNLRALLHFMRLVIISALKFGVNPSCQFNAISSGSSNLLTI